jgi:hypothetical protein
MVANAHTPPAPPSTMLAAAKPSTHLNPNTLKWTPPTKFASDGSTITAADFQSYQFGYQPVGGTGSYVVVSTVPVTQNQDAVSISSLNLPQDQALAVSMRVVATNGQVSAWSTPVFLKNDKRIPAAPAGLVLS